MYKKFLPLVVVPLLLSGCAATITNLTPRQQSLSSERSYRVEVALSSRQQTLRWDSIRAQIVVGNQTYPMQPTSLMTNRWEGLIPVPAGVKEIQYHYKFDYNNNAFGKPKPDSTTSPEYTLRIE